MIWSVAWRNIWRNKLRSTVIIIAIAIGIFAGVFIWAFYRGMVNQRIESAITTESSNLQLHHREYLTNPDQMFYIPSIDSVAGIISKIEIVKAVAHRIIVNAMISSAENGSGVEVIGIDPLKEQQVTNIWTKVTEGTYFKSDRQNTILISQKLADKLAVKIRSRIVLTLQTMDSTLITGLFRVEGIYKTNNSVYDETNVFVRNRDISILLNLDSHSGHELAILLKDNDDLIKANNMIQQEFPAYDVRTWKEIMPEIDLVEQTMDIWMYLFMGVVLIALIFGIVNTMLMAVLERVKELGMLMAVGMSRYRIFRMILLETVLLSLTGGVIGIFAANMITLFYSYKGIDLSIYAQAYEKLGYNSLIYTVTDFDISLKVTVMVLITGILAALFPAWKAMQLKPAEALRVDI
jgi:putative ABC transport system permease protein